MTTKSQLEAKNISLCEAIKQKEGQLDAFVQGLVDAEQSTRSQIKADACRQYKERLSIEYDRRCFAERKLIYEYDNVESAVKLLKEGLGLIEDLQPFPGQSKAWIKAVTTFINEMENGDGKED